MKCARCGADITAQRKCSKCGLHVADFRKELEVEYKDFKTSELLDIRQKRRTEPSRAEPKTSGKQPGERAVKRESPAKPSPKDEKSPFPTLAVVVLVLAVIIGGFFLVRLLILP